MQREEGLNMTFLFLLEQLCAQLVPFTEMRKPRGGTGYLAGNQEHSKDSFFLLTFSLLFFECVSLV